ncbi:hypothetical protein [Cohnella hongkongensis]|uniref:Tissue inhibitor of metalloproteinase n=1 Tax=Cohnella hongkongensis TaxID=178337 RepID=A0ABV9F7U7_9BACL
MRTVLTLWAALLAALAGGLAAAPGTAYACSCAAPPSVQEEMARKTAIFSGRVTQVIKPDKEVVDSSVDLVKIKFDVDRVWKGELARQTTVYTSIGSESCGYVSFEPGTSYLVSAYGSPDRLETGMCELTKPAEHAGADIQQLGAGREPLPGSAADSQQNLVWLWPVPLIGAGLLLVWAKVRQKGGRKR